jgi:uncharacterized membrane protein
MTRRRFTSWFHRWSRMMIGGISAIGVLETAYLTIAKLTHSSVVCPTTGCDRVLYSGYAVVFGVVPLSLLGFLAYLFMGSLAFAPLVVNPGNNKEARSSLEKNTWFGMFILSTAMPFFSGYLMYAMAFKIKELCIYCVSSAVFSLILFILTLIGHEWENIGRLFITGPIVAMVALFGALGIYYNVKAPAPVVAGNTPPLVTTVSGQAEIELARYLTKIGAKEYGAYWCPHCQRQRLLFGKQASSLLNYVECDFRGQNSQAALCQTVGIKAYPTWEIHGKFYNGVQSLSELSDFSGYSGDRNFKNSLPPE